MYEKIYPLTKKQMDFEANDLGEKAIEKSIPKKREHEAIDRKISPHHQRSKLVVKCMDLLYTGEQLLELLDRVNTYPEEEREAEAARIIAELESTI